MFTVESCACSEKEKAEGCTEEDTAGKEKAAFTRVVAACIILGVGALILLIGNAATAAGNYRSSGSCFRRKASYGLKNTFIVMGLTPESVVKLREQGIDDDRLAYKLTDADYRHIATVITKKQLKILRNLPRKWALIQMLLRAGLEGATLVKLREDDLLDEDELMNLTPRQLTDIEYAVALDQLNLLRSYGPKLYLVKALVGVGLEAETLTALSEGNILDERKLQSLTDTQLAELEKNLPEDQLKLLKTCTAKLPAYIWLCKEPGVEFEQILDLQQKRDQQIIEIIVTGETRYPGYTKHFFSRETKTGADDTLWALLAGDVTLACPPSDKIVRQGYQFQVVDMRWGVRDEATDDHRTTDLCLREIERCTQISTGPCFVSLLFVNARFFLPQTLVSHKYGWFRLDGNAVPPTYILQPISSQYPDFLSNEEAALTETEIRHGLLASKNLLERGLWFYRHIDHMDDVTPGQLSSRFKDLKGSETQNKESRELLENLKKEMEDKLPPDKILTYDVIWNKERGIDPEKDKSHRDYISRLCTDFEKKLMGEIETAIKTRDQGLHVNPLLEEVTQHTRFAQEKCSSFYGRQNALERVREYLKGKSQCVHVIHGKSGSGKTSIVAMAAREALAIRHHKGGVILRFLGTTPDSTTVSSLLSSIICQLTAVKNRDMTFSEEDIPALPFQSMKERTDMFHELLEETASADFPVTLLLDSLDQLDPADNARQLTWLPTELPAHVKVIVSTLPEEQYEAFPKLQMALIHVAKRHCTAGRGGLTETELEDVLSCDDDVLNDVYTYWTPPVRRLPPLLLVRLKADLGQYLVDRGADGVRVFFWYHRQFIEAAEQRYCNDLDTRLALHTSLSHFFAGTWANGNPKPYTDKSGKAGQANRNVGQQPLKFDHSFNLRKLNNLPFHSGLAQQREMLKRDCLLNFAFLQTKLQACGVRALLDDFSAARKAFPRDEDLKMVAETLQLSQDALQYDPKQLPSQILCRIVSPREARKTDLFAS
nr:hypothetical protein BaRGS_032013 [Batillaria attramentaria]